MSFAATPFGNHDRLEPRTAPCGSNMCFNDALIVTGDPLNEEFSEQSVTCLGPQDDNLCFGSPDGSRSCPRLPTAQGHDHDEAGYSSKFGSADRFDYGKETPRPRILLQPETNYQCRPCYADKIMSQCYKLIRPLNYVAYDLGIYLTALLSLVIVVVTLLRCCKRQAMKILRGRADATSE